MSKSMFGRARRGIALACAVLALTSMAGAGVASAKTTKKKAAATKKKAATTKKAAASTAPRATGGDQGPAKNIVGTEVGPGDPIRLGILGAPSSEAGGNVERMYEIAFAQLRKEGRLPVHGRDVVPYFRAHASDAAAQRAACTSAVQDDKVFVAITWAQSALAMECLAAEYKIPVVGTSITDESMARSFPYAFTVFASTTRSLRNIAYWADSEGLLKGRKIGLYHGNGPGRQQLIDEHMKPSFKKLGYTITEDISGGNVGGVADPASDRVAVQRLKAAGVNTVFLMTQQPGPFSIAARGQGYRPKYIFAGSETSIVCDGCPLLLGLTKDLFDGTYGMGGGRASENGLGGNPATHPAGVKCADNYERLSGERVRQDGTFFEQTRWQSVQWSCLEAEIVYAALKAAGPKLTQGSYLNGLETAVKGIQSGFFPDITFSRTNHFGGTSVRTVVIDGDCMCWKIKTPLREFFVE